MSWDSVGTLANNTISSVWDRVSFTKSPFETIFGNVAPIAAFYANPLLGLVFVAGEAFGYGPGLIGRYLDSQFGLKGGGVKPVISLESAAAAASNIVNTITSKIGSLLSFSSLKLDKRALRDLENLCIVTSYDTGFLKIALGKVDIIKNIWRGIIGGKKGGKGGIIKTLTGFLFTLLKGVVGFGVIGGIAKTVAGKKETINPTSFLPSLSSPGKGDRKEVQHNVPTGWLFYRNNRNSVQDSLIGYLNGEIAGFSNMFFQENKTQLFNAPQMRKVLKLIEKNNYDSIANLNSGQGFVAPRLKDLAKKIMPNYKFTRIDTHKPQTKSGGANER